MPEKEEKVDAEAVEEAFPAPEVPEDDEPATEEEGEESTAG